MPSDPPIDFEALSKRGGSPSTGGYPYSIKAADLMKNFVYATLDAADALLEQTTGRGGHPQRKLKIDPGTATGQLMQWNGSRWTPLPTPTNANTLLVWNGTAWVASGAPTAAGQLLRWNGTAWTPLPAPPSTGTHVLGAVGGALQWIATEEC